jgi:putative ABC transport system permease protein
MWAHDIPYWISDLGGLFLVSIQQGALYGLVTLALVLSFRIVRFYDLTVDGSFAVGGAVIGACSFYYRSPWLGMAASVSAGALSGALTALLSIKLRINQLLAGILVMTALYSVSLRIMNRSNIPLGQSPTILSSLEFVPLNQLWLSAAFLVVLTAIGFSLWYLLATEVGLHLRAAGENPELVVGLARNVNLFVVLALAISNGVVAMSGALVAQHYGFADVSMGSGVVVIGLACLCLGEVLPMRESVRNLLLASVLGSIIFHLIKNIALRVGVPPIYLKLVTVTLVVAALLLRPRARQALTQN